MATAFIDSNVFIYATTASQEVPNCLLILELAAVHHPACVTSAEVLQEILHVLGRRNPQARVLDALRLALATTSIYPLEAEDVLAAAQLPLPHLSARDRIYCALMQRYEVGYIISADADFDRVPGITRLNPADLPAWRGLVFGSS